VNAVSVAHALPPPRRICDPDRLARSKRVGCRDDLIRRHPDQRVTKASSPSISCSNALELKLQCFLPG
jgi:hypothetical protein